MLIFNVRDDMPLLAMVVCRQLRMTFRLLRMIMATADSHGVLTSWRSFDTLAAIAIHFPLFLLLGAIVLICQGLNWKIATTRCEGSAFLPIAPGGRQNERKVLSYFFAALTALLCDDCLLSKIWIMLSYDSEMSCQCFRFTKPAKDSKITAAKSTRGQFRYIDWYWQWPSRHLFLWCWWCECRVWIG